MFTLLLRFAALACVLLVPWVARGAALEGFAAMGASETQGTAHKGSWVPYLAIDRGLNFGPNQSYNKAVGGSTSSSLLTGGQHTAVASLVEAGNVDLAFLFIGGLDVPPVASKIMAGTLNVPVWADGVVSNILTAVDTVMAENPAGMVVAGLPDMRLVPGSLEVMTPEQAQPIADAIDLVNGQLKSEVLNRDLVYLDVATAMRDMYASPPVVGGVLINMTVGSSDPTHFFQDDIHPAVVGNGIFANLMMTALNEGHETGLALITDQEILARAGLSGSYTGETSALDYGKYVITLLPGDANRDGYVDGSDYTLWADNYLSTVGTWETGDFTGDGLVDGSDYTVWADNYAPAAASAAMTVPEPATLSLAGIALAALLARQRARRTRIG